MQVDYAIVGGGLQGALLALALRAQRPAASLALIECSPFLGGNHLWSFFPGQLPAAARALVAPLVVRRWPGYQVAFADHARTFEEEYASISSQRLDEVVRAALSSQQLLRAEAAHLEDDRVLLRDGRTVRARLVIDARGPANLQTLGEVAFQKFCGVELRVSQAPRLPMLMDATVTQRDGLRFIYLLPLASDRVLIEDTRFSLSPLLDVGELEEAACAYGGERGLRGEVVRREQGVLPLPLDRLSDAPPGRVLRAGYGGGFFHPTTGYSLDCALRLALHVAAREPEQAQGPDYQALLARLRRQQRFGMLLNRLLYRATDGARQWQVFSRFHRLAPDLIARFHTLQTTRVDRARILCGRPPRGVSLRRAMRELRA